MRKKPTVEDEPAVEDEPTVEAEPVRWVCGSCGTEQPDSEELAACVQCGEQQK